MIAAFLLAACLGTGERPGAEILKALAAREQALKRATWKYHASHPQSGPHPSKGKAVEGTVQLSDGAIAVLTEDPKGRRRRIQTPQAEWTELVSPSGRLLELSRTRPPEDRPDLSFATAEMLALAVAGSYDPPSRYLENALVEQRPDGVVRFTVAETKRQRESHRLEFDFEGSPPYRLQEFRLFIDDERRGFLRNRQLGEAGGHWYAKQAQVGKKADGEGSAFSVVTIHLDGFQPSSPPIDFAKLEAGLADQNAAVTDEFRSTAPKRP